MNKVSVVLPTYNCAEFLERAIQSVLNQTYKNIEFIIVNDGSTDNTPEILDKYKNQNSIRIFSQENMGANPARNNGAKHATGEYLIFMESDVILNPQIIEKMVKILDEKPEISYVYCDYEYHGRIEGVKIARPFNIDELLRMNYISAVSLMRREYFPGFDPEIKGFQDWDMWLTMCENGYIGEYMPGIYFEAIQREGGISESVHNNWNERVLDIYGKHKRVAIFTLTKDRIEYTKRMFDALEQRTHRKYDHYIVDQGSTDGTVDYLKVKLEKGEIKKLILNKENTGISFGSNQALDAIGNSYDYIMKLDNDCEVLTDNWLSELIKLLTLGNNAAILSPYVEGIGKYGGSDKTGMLRYQYVQANGHTIGITTHVGGISVIAPANIYNNFRFDIHDNMSGTQDVSFSRFALMNGYAIGYVEDIMVAHMDGTGNQIRKYPEYFKLRKIEETNPYIPKE